MKCELLKSEVEYLDQVLSEDGIRTNPEKIRRSGTWPIPRGVKEVRTFLGIPGITAGSLGTTPALSDPSNTY